MKECTNKYVFFPFQSKFVLPGNLSFSSDVSRYFLGELLPAQQVVMESL